MVEIKLCFCTQILLISIQYLLLNLLNAWEVLDFMVSKQYKKNWKIWSRFWNFMSILWAFCSFSSKNYSWNTNYCTHFNPKLYLHDFYGILYHVLTYYSLLSPIYKEIFYFKNVAHFNPKSTPTYILNQFYGQELIFFCSIAFAKKYFDKSHTFYSRLNKPYKVAHFHPKSSPKVTILLYSLHSIILQW